MIIDGVAASSAIDSSGETIDIEGMDLSDCHEGKCYLNFEHKSQSEDLCGLVIFAKKIFSKKDCDDKRQESDEPGVGHHGRYGALRRLFSNTRMVRYLGRVWRF